jgi:hypothetical protein
VRTLTRSLGVAATTTALLAGGLAVSPAASADDDDREGTTFVAPSETTRSVLLGVVRPAALTKRGAAFPITEVEGSRIEHVGGLRLKELDDRTRATSITIRNFVIDTRRGTVSAAVQGAGRAVVFTLGSGGTLLFTEAASKAITGGSSLTGTSAGVATVELDRDDDD